MSTRLHALAWSLPDMQPGPKTMSTGAIRGESPVLKEPCDPCDGTGWTKDRFGRAKPCENCGGGIVVAEDGTVTRVKGLGWYHVDPFTLQRGQSADSTAPPRGRRVPCDRCGTTGVMPGRWIGEDGLVRCEGCDGAGHLTVPVDSDSPRRVFLDGSPLGRARARGDWEPLENALGRLLGVSQASWRLFVRARVECLPCPEPERLAEVERWLLGELPRPLRCPADVVAAYEDRQRRADEQLKARMDRIVQGQRKARRRQNALEAQRLSAAGQTVTEIALVLGEPRSSVGRWVQKAAA